MNAIFFLIALLLAAAPAYAEAPFDAFKATGIDQKPDAIIPLDLPFLDENGKEVTLRGLSGGKPIVLVPVLHNCPNICGVTLSGLMQAVAAQHFRPGTDFALVAFGIDPKEGPNDAKNSLEELRRRFPKLLRDGVHALTGTAANVHAVTNALGYRYAWDAEINQYAHIAATSVLTPQGKLSRWLYGLAPTATDLKLALTEAGQGEIGSWTDQVLLLCYCYDPQTGQYSSIISTALRIGGGTTAAICLGGVGWAFARERRKQQRRESLG